MSEADKKNGLTDWDSIDAKGGKNKFLRLKSGSTYTIRLFHKPKELYRYYHNRKSAITADPENCPVTIRHPEVKAKLRYAINVIDRSDPSMVKILEAPAMVFKEFRKFYETNQIDPGGTEAPDFVIKVEGEGINTKYSVGYKMKATPFTPEEIELLKAGRHNLDEVFKPTENIEEHLFSGGTGEGVATQPAGNPGSKGDDAFPFGS